MENELYWKKVHGQRKGIPACAQENNVKQMCRKNLSTQWRQIIHVTAVATLLLLFAATTPTTALAAAKKYKNCTAMHKEYKGGISRNGAKDKRSKGDAKYKPVVNNSLYQTNAGLDRDKDGIACEQ